MSNAGLAPCPACGSATQQERSVFDDRYGHPGSFPLMKCPACGHRHLRASMAPTQFEELYTRYYPRSKLELNDWTAAKEKSAWITWWRGLTASAYRWVPRGVRVLDIGCGLGESLGYHRARGCDAEGVDADHNITQVAQRHGLKVRVGLFDANCYEAASFDYVTLDQVVEHVAQPVDVLRGIHRVLKPGGTLVLSTPNADGWGARLFGSRWIHWHAPYHLHFFSRESMSRCAEQAGLLLRQTATVTESAWLDFQWGHLVTLPLPGCPSPYWQPVLGRTLGERIALKLLRVVDRLGVNSALTRIADLAGHGDNVVYVMVKADNSRP